MLTPEEVLRLVPHIQARQFELGLDVDEVASPNTYKGLMRGRPARMSTMKVLDNNLRWVPGSALRTARGDGVPKPLPDDRASLVVDFPGGSGAASEAEVWTALGGVAADAPNMTPQGRAQLIAVVRALVERDIHGG